MNTDLLRDFIVLANYQHFSIAAEECYISQSTLSKRMQRLEAEVGTKLIQRTTKQVNLTANGEILLSYANKILALEQECLEQFQLTVDTSKVLKIGAIPSLSKYNLMTLISEFKSITHLEIEIITASSENLEIAIQEGTCDGAFIRQVHDPANLFGKQPITTDQLVAVLPKDHPLIKSKTIKISTLKNETFALLPKNSRPYQNCLHLCQKAGFTPQVLLTDSKISTIIDFVSSGLGVSILMSKNITPDYAKNVVVLPIKPKIEEVLSFCYLKENQSNDKLALLIDFVNQQKII